MLLTTLSAQLQTRTYTSVRLEGEPPDIDGVISESVWDLAEWGGEFIQRDPYEGESPSQETAFKILFDDNDLYVAIRAYDTAPDSIEKRLTRRDDIEGDWVSIAIDSYFDRRTSFNFAVSAAGVKMDLRLTNDDEMDFSWDPVWYVKVTSDAEGWVAEMKIPLTQLRFSDEKDHVWGLQVMRNLFRKEEFSIWQFIPVEASGWVSLFGDLNGIRDIHPKKEIELIPYVMGNFRSYEKEEGNPFATGKDFGYSAGLDGKIAVTNDLTLNFTINPDFGQVEADPSEVNLTAFESFFEERRPFFVEGSNIYDYPLTAGNGPLSSDNLFYSRRIGRQPHHYPDDENGEYVKQPEYTTILGAFKLSGKTRNGWSVGILESLTSREQATIDLNGERSKETVEPLTNYFNTRLQKDFKKGKTIVGGMFTATNRMIADSSVDYLPTSAYTGGLDFTNFWRDKDYYLSVTSVFSHVAGSKESITDLQESSRRYYQRPDAPHLELDTNRTTLFGNGGTIEGGKIGGGHWRFGGWLTWRTPGLELNDMGYLRQADMIQQVLWGGYRIWEPFSIFRSLNFNFSQYSGWDFSVMNLYNGGNINTHMQFENYWSFGTGYNISAKSVSRSELRGGPAIWFPGNTGTWFFIETDERKKLVFDFSAHFSWGGQHSYRGIGVNPEISWRPLKSLQLSLEPGYQKAYRTTQYVTTEEYNGEDRYIMARLDQEILSADFRINLSITPDLSIQYWGQPFIFAGNYSEYKRITNPMADQFSDQYHVFTESEISYNEPDNTYEIDENQDGTTDYSFENPDFNFYEFRSNLVLRWEYIPGSTIFVVWSQGREGDKSTGNFNLGEDFDYLFKTRPQDVFLIKVSYRLSF